MPQVLHCTGFSDLPALRAGGVVYLLRNAQDGGLGKYFAAKGFTVQDNVLSDAALNDYYGVSVRSVPSATRLLVAVGGYAVMEAGKLLAKISRLPLWCVPTDWDAVNALTDYSLWVIDHAPTFVGVPDHTVIRLDSLLISTRDGIQQAYQHLFGYYVSLAANVYRNRFTLNEADNARLKTVLARVKETLLSIDEYCPSVGQTLWDTIAQAAEVCDDKEIQLLAKTICVYKKENMAYNRYIFAAAYALTAALGECRDLPDLALPPDRVAVAQTANRLDWRLSPPPSIDGLEYRRIDWVWRDYLSEWEEVADAAKRIARHWRRIAGSSGFGYFEDLSAGELVSLLPVAAELTPTYTPFKHLYLRGGLNLFI